MERATKKQIAYAKSLGISNPEKFSKRELSKKIEKALNYSSSVAEEVVAEEVVAEEYSSAPLDWKLKVELPVIIVVSEGFLQKMSWEALIELKKENRKFIQNYNEVVLYFKFLFQKKLLKKHRGNFYILCNTSGFATFSVVAEFLESHFVPFEWDYK